MSHTSIAVFGICPERRSADKALQTLRTAGFRNTDVSVVFSEADSGDPAQSEEGMLAWLAGIGALSVPGMGLFIAAGPVMGLLGGLGTQAPTSGLAGALIALGIPEYEARGYERRMRSGGVLISVLCDSEEWARRARSVLDQHDAEEISRNTAARGAGAFQHGD